MKNWAKWLAGIVIVLTSLFFFATASNACWWAFYQPEFPVKNKEE